MNAVDWARYRACPHCFAELGRPCMQLSGLAVGELVAVTADGPHGGRPLRTTTAKGTR